MARFQIRPRDDGSLPPVRFSTGVEHEIVLPRPPPGFEVRVVDDVGDPVEGIELEFLVAGQSTKVTSDGDGLARHDEPGPSTAGVRLADLEATREVMEPRWAEDHEGETPAASDEVVHVPVRKAWQGATLERGVRRTLVLLPSLVCVRLLGMHFDTSKAFLLPGALRGMKRLREIYDDHPDARVVACGHTDTSGSKDYNLQLSLERAEAIIAYLTDDVDAWNAWFGADKPAEKRWGTLEIQHMLMAVPSPEEPYYTGGADGVAGSGTRGGVERLQADHGLPVSGTVDEATRKALITDYMSKDGTTLPEGVEALTHGCGELFPAVATGDSVALQANRRVDVFFFDGAIHPPWPGPLASEGEPEYPAWRDRALQTHELDADATETADTTSQILVHLRSNSGCVPLADRPYRIDVDGTVHEGVTDGDGLASAREIPPGDHGIEVEGRKSLVASRPTGSPAVTHVVGGFFLG
jgi:outer membrane protein OmpA-like peptidoglycan-associated protein